MSNVNSVCSLFKMKPVATLLCILVLASPLVTHAQQRIEIEDAEGQRTTWAIPAGGWLRQSGDSTALQSDVYDPNEKIRLIVQFRSAPLSDGSAGKGAAHEVEREALYATLARLQQGAAKRSSVRTAAQVTHDYRKAFNGVALTVPRWMRSHVEGLPGVDHVTVDQAAALYTASSTASQDATSAEVNAIIGADRVHEELGFTGKGVLVGIVADGIDYLHPALGGGIGPESKVRGGYNLYAPGTLPRDDRYHTTLMAGGIAGQSDVFTGVAPGAQLLPIKVSNGGHVFTSDVLAGIEYAIDPDGDPTSADQPHVLLLPFAHAPQPNHPLHAAIARATATGIVCVAQGGIDHQPLTIMAPGTAPEAITVVASTKEDEVDHFFVDYNSEGPTPYGFLNKPDLAAPSHDVTSTYPTDYPYGDLYGIAPSGAYMGAAYVAGAAALLLEAFPEWTPAQVKSALTQGAKDLGEPLWTQGSGRLDVYTSITAAGTLSPSTISLGLLPESVSSVSRTETLTLHNASSTAQTYDVALNGIDTVPGVQAAVSPTQVRLSAGESRAVTFTFRADVSQVPPLDPPFRDQYLFSDAPSPGYFGEVVARSTRDTLVVPVSFSRTHHLQLHFDRTPTFISINGARYSSGEAEPTAASLATPLPSGTYDVLVEFTKVTPDGDVHMSYAVLENVDVTGSIERSVTAETLEHAVNLDLRDRDGQPMGSDHTTYHIHIPGRIAHKVAGLTPASLRFNSFSARTNVSIATHNVTHPSSDDYALAFEIGEGLSASTVLTSNPADYVPLTTRVTHSAENPSDVFLIPRTSTERTWNEGSTASYLVRSWAYAERLEAHYRMFPPYERRTYVNPRTRTNTVGVFSHYVQRDQRPITSGDYYLTADSLYIYPSYHAQDISAQGRQSHQTLPARPLTVSLGLPAVRMQPPNRYLSSFISGFGDQTYGEISWAAYDNDQLSRVGTLRNTFPPDLPLNSGTTRIELAFDHFDTDGVPGANRMTVTVQPYQDTDAGTLRRFSITTDGLPSDVFSEDAPPSFYIEPVGERNVIRLFYRRYGDTEWTRLTTRADGLGRRAEWPSQLPEAYYDLSIDIDSRVGIRRVQRLIPAFRYGDKSAADNQPPHPPQLSASPDTLGVGTNTLATFAWVPATDADVHDTVRTYWNMQGPEGTLRLAATTDSTMLVDLARHVNAGETYRWWVEAADGFSTVSSDTATVHIVPTSVNTDDFSDQPTAISLTGSFPNPFTDVATVTFALPRALSVRLEVFDALGRRVATLTDGWHAVGTHRIAWNALEAPNGVYFARLKAGDQVQTLRMVRTR